MKNENDLSKNLNVSENENPTENNKMIISFIIILSCILLGVYFFEKTQKSELKTDNQTEEVMFSYYMKDFQKKVKENWNPPHNEVSKSVVLFIEIDKHGKVLKNKVIASSGNEELDKSAIDAVYKSEPFSSFPAKYKDDKVAIQFTFDYNVFGKKK